MDPSGGGAVLPPPVEPPFGTSSIYAQLDAANTARRSNLVIEYHMLDKTKFFPLSMASSFCVRGMLHPLTVVKTRLQVQKHKDCYNGTYDAFRKIHGKEGMQGLYKGFWVSTFQLVSGLVYMGTYEYVRDILLRHELAYDSRVRGAIAGLSASVVAQSIIVPFDVMSQHLMILGQERGKGRGLLNPLGIDYKGRSSVEVCRRISSAIYAQQGLLGFYKGYGVSLATYAPNSAMWWGLYHTYWEQLGGLLPSAPPLLLQCVSASLGGATTALLTNPLDITRARLQTQGEEGIVGTVRRLWREEGLAMLWKGATARLTHTCIYSAVAIGAYETVKRCSLSDQYRELLLRR